MNFDTAKLLLELAGYCLISHIVLSIALRFNTRADPSLVDQLFASPPWGSAIGKTPWRLQAKYFLPWASGPDGLSTQSTAVRLLFSFTRLAGFATIVLLVTFLVTVIYLGTG